MLPTPFFFILLTWVPGFLDRSPTFPFLGFRNGSVFAFGVVLAKMGFQVLLSYLCLLLGGGGIENGSFFHFHLVGWS